MVTSESYMWARTGRDAIWTPNQLLEESAVYAVNVKGWENFFPLEKEGGNGLE